jgi:hypothetical protein
MKAIAAKATPIQATLCSSPSLLFSSDSVTDYQRLGFEVYIGWMSRSQVKQSQ